MNETLEAMARALFKSWFVDFDPVRAKMEGRAPAGMDAETAALFPDSFEDSELGSIPKGWSCCTLPEVIDFQEGPGILAKDFRASGVPLIRLAGLQQGTSLFAGCNYLDPEIVASRWAHFQLRRGDTLLSTSATLGRVAVVNDEAEGAIAYTGIIRMRPRDGRMHENLIRHFLASPSFQRQVESMGVGSVIRHFGPSHLRAMTVVAPPISLQRAAASYLAPLDEMLKHNFSENETLASTRDLLLPRLLSGELRIKDAEKLAEATL
ncbi:hypothetical protein BE21_01225 [Sorangium cellulosum]|uniref:Uncharacterized protein n=1 Tax=Sorangium cellulosum TaxID=56 RepID=A0A150U1J9_SORCE|nr:hypothetical protein BE21_01225 [Sorangium cellulosum]